MSRALPGGAKFVPFKEGAPDYQTPEMVSKQVYSEARIRDAKAKMTWNPAKVKVTDTAGNPIGYTGEFNKYLPWISIPGQGTDGRDRTGKYYIQNGRILLSNGTPISMDEIAEKWPADLPRVEDAYEKFLLVAEAKDPMLCKICKAYSADNIDDSQDHLITAHPDEVLRRLGGASSNGETPSNAATTTAPPSPVSFSCCSKIFDSNKAMLMHQRIARSHKDV